MAAGGGGPGAASGPSAPRPPTPPRSARARTQPAGTELGLESQTAAGTQVALLRFWGIRGEPWDRPEASSGCGFSPAWLRVSKQPRCFANRRRLPPGLQLLSLSVAHSQQRKSTLLERVGRVINI